MFPFYNFLYVKTTSYSYSRYNFLDKDNFDKGAGRSCIHGNLPDFYLRPAQVHFLVQLVEGLPVVLIFLVTSSGSAEALICVESMKTAEANRRT